MRRPPVRISVQNVVANRTRSESSFNYNAIRQGENGIVKLTASKHASANPLKSDITGILRSLDQFVQFNPRTTTLPLERYVANSLDSFTDGFEPVNLLVYGPPESLPPIQFRPGGAIRHGGGGIIIQCWRAAPFDRPHALKIPRPSNLSAPSEPNLPHRRTAKGILTAAEYSHWIRNRLAALESASHEAETSDREAVLAAKLTHENIIRLDALSSIQLPVHVDGQRLHVQQRVGLYEWIEQSEPFDDFVFRHVQNWSGLLDLLSQALRGIAYLHGRTLIHWDIKSDNCLVTTVGTADAKPRLKIIDVGNARRMQPESYRYSSDETVYTSASNAPRQLMSSVDYTKLHRAVITLRAESKCVDRPKLDLFYFGRMFGRVISLYTDKKVTPEYRASRAALLSRLGGKDETYRKLKSIYTCLTDWKREADPDADVVLAKILAVDGRQPIYTPQAGQSGAARA